jgi:uncharacterized membrane protein
MSIGHIWGSIQIVVGILMLVEGYFVAKEMIKPSKTTVVFQCVIIGVLFLSGSLKYF